MSSEAPADSNAQGVTEYIIRLHDYISIDEHIRQFNEAYNRADFTGHRVIKQWDTSFMNAYVGEFHPDVLAVLRTHHNVQYVSENAQTKSAGFIKEQTDACWGLARIQSKTKLSGKASDLTFKYKYDQDEENGHDVDVYVIDTGIFIGHNDFEGRAVWGTTIQKSTTQKPISNDDENGHGTHVAGIIGGKRWGVAKNVKLIAVKVSDEQGHASITNELDAIQWVLTAVKKSEKRSVVNISRGVTPYNRAWNEAATKLTAANIHVAVAAGNGVPDSKKVYKGVDARNFSPASAPLVNTVGSVNIEDKKSDTSNYGGCVDLFAPGVDITSCWIDKKDGKKDPNSTKSQSGTSMATPHVTGIIATFISLHGNIKPLEMTNVLKTLGNYVTAVGLFTRGALHVSGDFKLVSNVGGMKILNHAIFSKVQSGASKYDSETTTFTTEEVGCDKNVYGTHQFLFMFVSAYKFVDLMVRHGRDGPRKDDKKGAIEVKFGTDTVAGYPEFIEWDIYKYRHFEI